MPALKTARHTRPLSGDFSAATPMELGQLLMLGNKTGALHLRSASDEGVLFFHKGSVVSAVGPGRLTGVEAAMAMLRWEEGAFDFIPNAATPTRDISVGTENLLLETARSMDEAGLSGAENVRYFSDVLDEPSVLDISALTDGRSAVPGQTPLLWVTEVPGRALVQIGQGPLVGLHPGGDRHRFGTEYWDPTSWLDAVLGPLPYEGWLDRPLGRVFVSATPELLRINHPVSAGSMRDVATEAEAIAAVLGGARPLVLVGADPARTSRLAARVSVSALARRSRVLHVTGIPEVTFDDEENVLHVVATDSSRAERISHAMVRFRPELLVLDVDADDGVLEVVRAARIAGIDVVVTSRAPDARAAKSALLLGAADAAEWRFVPGFAAEARRTDPRA